MELAISARPKKPGTKITYFYSNNLLWNGEKELYPTNLILKGDKCWKMLISKAR